MNHNVLITGGAGFIGSHVVRFFVNSYPNYQIYNLDILSYAATLDNLTDINNNENYTFIKGDICDKKLVKNIFKQYKISRVIHLAAESHVDRSITDPLFFATTNVMGTLNLLQAAKESWNCNYLNNLFYHISTDEVFGTLGKDGLFLETSKYDPHSPYAASKASSDHFVRSYKDTYGLPVVISNCSNNFGPNQFTEKLIPLVVQNIINKKPIPVYGNGENIRDWLYVDDHVRAIDLIFHKGKIGETYNIGGSNEMRNIDLIHELINITDPLLNRPKGTSLELINYVSDRPGHDLRYAIDSSKLQRELGWNASRDFKKNIKKTVSWYIKKLRKKDS
ncbi:MAG: dTDP-glucose 4,6-dehydratase [Flavobacteriaceae bacterium]|nr:dTDP-glucose 4,6-dehydratase [Flavobacteriaceae bacterium]